MGRPETTPDRFHCADRNLNPRKGIHTPHARYEFVRDPIRPVVGMQELSRTSTQHSKYVTFQLAEVAVPRELFAAILQKIARLAMPPPSVGRAHA